MNLFIVFCVLNVLNVVLQTVKSLCTINCGRWVAATMNAVAFGLYQVILVLAVCDLPLWQKVVVVSIANFVGVFATKTVQYKMRKDKLWKVEATISKNSGKFSEVVSQLKSQGIPFNYIDINKYFLFNCYCATQKESTKVKRILTAANAKFFVSESKML